MIIYYALLKNIIRNTFDTKSHNEFQNSNNTALSQCDARACFSLQLEMLVIPGDSPSLRALQRFARFADPTIPATIDHTLSSHSFRFTFILSFSVHAFDSTYMHTLLLTVFLPLLCIYITLILLLAWRVSLSNIINKKMYETLILDDSYYCILLFTFIIYN